MNVVTTQSELQIKKLEPKKVNHKGTHGEIVKEYEKFVEDKTDNKGTKV